MQATPIPIDQDEYAGMVSRAIALILDLLIINTALGVTVSLFTLFLRFVGLEFLFSPDSSNVSRITVVLSSGVLFFLIQVIYSTFFWTLAGQTPGKAFIGLRVVNGRAETPTLRQSVKRALGYWLSALPLGAGFFWVLLQPQRQAWHDRLAGTYVIYQWRRQDEVT